MSSERRFVILEHDHPSLHWDFMLEADGVLRTWRLPSFPIHGEMAAEQLVDHRLAYLDYEGAVSCDRGSVKRYDRGTYRVVAATDDRIEVELSGTAIVARVLLERRAGAAWRATWRL